MFANSWMTMRMGVRKSTFCRWVCISWGEDIFAACQDDILVVLLVDRGLTSTKPQLLPGFPTNRP